MKNGNFKYASGRAKFVSVKLFFAVICLFVRPVQAISQSVENLTIEKVQGEGLTSESILSISQDSDGFIWFGTSEGLFRYDGYSFKGFKHFPGDPKTLINNGATTLYPDGDHLWVGTAGGLSCVDINTLTIKNIPSGRSEQINDIYARDDSVLWIATGTGLYQFNKKNYRWTLMPAVKHNALVNGITDDRNGHFYLISSDGFYEYNIKTAQSVFHPLDFPTYPGHKKGARVIFLKSVLDNEGNLWIGSWDAGLVCYNTKNGKTTSWFHPTDDVHFQPFKIIMSLLPDKGGNIWLANKDGGLTIFSPSKNKFTNYPVEWKNENKISGPVVRLFRDRSGIVWIGTENGIFKYDPHRVSLSKSYLSFKTDTGLVPAHISPISMYKDRDGLWWLGMYEGLFFFDEKTGILKNANSVIGLPEQLHTAVFNIGHDTNGAIWVTAKNLLIKVTRSGTGFKSHTFQSDSIKSALYSLLIDRENRVWIGTHGDGVYRFDTMTNKFISYHYEETGPNSGINEIRAFCELSKDSILFGGANTGLILLHPNTGKHEKVKLGVPERADNSFSVDAIYKNDGKLWLGTDDNGLWQTNTRFAVPVVTTINDGLPSMSIGPIAGDKLGNIWFLTGAGLVKLHTDDKKITVFNKKDGIENLLLYTMVVDSNNTVSFGSRGVIYNIDPEKTIKNEAAPAVLITGLRIFDKDYNINTGTTVKLNYNQNYFTFDYLALNYTQSHLNKYAYKMVGLDKKWNYAGSRRYVSYANLDEGTYSFCVKACNNEGVWNDIPAKFTLIIAPPFWHRWWFFLIAVVAIGGAIYSLYVYNIKQLKIRLLMRDKIARDLHDDIGSTLSGINIFSNIALQKLSPGQPARELVEKISDKSQKSLEALSDIVWSIDTRNDDMEDFVMKANEYLSVLDAQAIAYDFSISPEAEQVKLGMVARRELYMVFKEAICNASKYAGCSFIKIHLTRHKDTCTLLVSDNGKGFDIDAVSSGNGLYNMKQRARKMMGDLHIETRVGKGTIVTLKFNITRFR